MPEDHRPSPLADVCAPIDRARGLPNAHYTDPATIAAENRACLETTWAAIGVGADVPEPGDAKPLSFLGQPLLLLRDDAGTVRVFYNICRHRGMILVEEPRKIEGAIRCPYHSWCYSKEGRLVATPHVGGPGQNAHPGIDRDAGPHRGASHVWRDVVFVNLSGDAPLRRDARRSHRPLGGVRPTDAPWRGRQPFTLEVRTNWKLAVENYCESYHLPWVHPGLNSYSRLEDHYNIEVPGRYSGQGTLVYRQLRGADGRSSPISQAFRRNGTKAPNMSRSIPTSCWACTATTPTPSSSNRSAMTTRWSISTSTTLPPRRMRPQGPQRNTVERSLHRGYRRRGGHAARPFRRRVRRRTVQPGDGRADPLLPRLGGRPNGCAGGGRRVNAALNGVARATLDTALLDAHARGDRAALIALYADAADAAMDPTARAFYLTHAYVFALKPATPAPPLSRPDWCARRGNRVPLIPCIFPQIRTDPIRQASRRRPL
jgi:phenylpropionate dioxygenase-like ring-hydroxylating dioxygenase large terminal subunit